MFRTFSIFPPEASNFAVDVDLLLAFEVGVSVLFTLLIAAGVIYFALRYRRRSQYDVPPPVPSPMMLEVTWTVIPFMIMLVMFFWGGEIYVRAKRPPEHAIEIQVIGKQWMWKIQHSNGAREINALHIPMGQPVRLIMASQDVIHDFGIPAFRVKQDVLPGSFTDEWFTATELGEFHFYCDQYCGAEHAKMVGTVVVMDPQKYAQWLAGASGDEPPANAGSRLFVTYGCNACHGTRGPTLAGLYDHDVQLDDGSLVKADEAYLRESIIEPAAKVVKGYPTIMPSYRAQLSEEQIMQLVEYIKSLGAARSDKGVMLAPATQPVNGQSPDRVPNFPPARQPPWIGQPPGAPGKSP